MDYKDASETLLKSVVFKDWQKKNEGCYLAHFFAEFDQKLKPDHWQIGFYDAKKDMITTFFIDEEITIAPSAEVFKEGGVVQKLDLNTVKVSASAALQHAHALQQRKYSAHLSLKGIAILQNLNIGIVWNITFVTQSFAALSIKVDARTGGILRDNLVSLFDLKK